MKIIQLKFTKIILYHPYRHCKFHCNKKIYLYNFLVLAFTQYKNKLQIILSCCIVIQNVIDNLEVHFMTVSLLSFAPSRHYFQTYICMYTYKCEICLNVYLI